MCQLICLLADLAFLSVKQLKSHMTFLISEVIMVLFLEQIKGQSQFYPLPLHFPLALPLRLPLDP